MALVPRPVRLTATDTWDSARERLSVFIEDVRNALARGLTVNENTAHELKEIEWVGGTTNQLVATKLKAPVYGAVAVFIREKNGAAVSSAYMDWEQAHASGSHGIKIRSISGLTANARYTVRLFLVGG